MSAVISLIVSAIAADVAAGTLRQIVAGQPKAKPTTTPSTGKTMTTYDGIKAINWSALKHLAVSPLLYRWRIDHPQPRTPALTLGAATHCLILEPEKFDSRYAIYEDRRAGKAWDLWQDEHPGVETLKPSEYERAQACAIAVRAHERSAPLIVGGRYEEVVTWVDAKTGLACKGRVDYVSPTRLVDLKTARDIDERRFRRAVADHLYHGQLAWYYDGLLAAGRINNSELPYLIAVQSAEPYDVGVYQMGGEDLLRGRDCYRTLLDRLVACTAANWWPGACPDVLPLDVPEWALGQPVTTEEDF